MGHLFRSEEMCLAQLYLQTEAAFSCVSELGELGLVEFRDLNPDVNAFQRKFVNEVRRCDDMERVLRFLENELKKDNIPIDDNGENPPAPKPKEMNELEARLEKLEQDMKEVNTNQEALKRNFLELTELKYILRKTQSFFDEAIVFEDDESQLGEEGRPLILTEISKGPNSKLGFVGGVLAREKMIAFERVLWRACRGNVFLRYAEIDTPLEDPVTGEMIKKNVFILFFQGDQLRTRVKKICEAFRASLYPCPETPQERREVAMGVMTRIEDLQTVLTQTQDHRRLVLTQVALNIRVWLIKVRKIKAIYHTQNMFNINIAEKCLIGECWCPVRDIDQIKLALRRGTEMSGSSVPSIMQRMKTDRDPPTYNRTDKFTSAFQGIVDAFGVADYREVNPAPFTIITFPFLFGVMFGDLGHGFLMFLSALYMVLNEKRFLAKKSDNEIWEIMFGGRYIILLMGLFSMYSGYLYNEVFSRSMNVFGSAWNVSAMDYSEEVIFTTPLLQLNPAKPGVFAGTPVAYPNGTGAPYPYGMDPIWQSALNKITFENSYKMKTAVILGCTQMVFGLMLALCNHLYFKHYLKLFTEWIPRMLFIWCVIGYLCIIIIYKWAVWKASESHSAPSLLIGLIDMFMFTGHPTLYTYQGPIQTVIVLLAVLCIPWMLLVRPAILYSRNKKRLAAGKGTLIIKDRDDDDLLAPDHDEATDLYDPETGSLPDEPEHEEEFILGEVMIHQIIHTIEYCLSCISHTASYLRLWALSLAHSELSEVLWTMVMHSGLAVKGYLGSAMLWAIFWGFAALTISILLIMEGLSAFLHALRLHWVEFQSKFYGGEGYMFVPFSFKAIVQGQVD